MKAITLAALLGLVMIASASFTALLRYTVSWRLKPLYHALVASFITAIVIACATIYRYELMTVLGVYPALLASNCLVMSLIQEVAERSPLKNTFIASTRNTYEICVLFGIFGAVRELMAYGSLFSDWRLLTSEGTVSQITPAGPLPIMASPPGALMTLAILIALSNAIARAQSSNPLPSTQGEQQTVNLETAEVP